jgi:hypothetical protein
VTLNILKQRNKNQDHASMLANKVYF